VRKCGWEEKGGHASHQHLSSLVFFFFVPMYLHENTLNAVSSPLQRWWLKLLALFEAAAVNRRNACDAAERSAILPVMNH
jgi:hypothetical protein